MALTKWIDTTLRHGTKHPKICRDMFITDSRGSLVLCIVKNGRQKSRVEINNIKLSELIKEYDLIGRGSGIFSGCSTYRTENGWKVIDKVLQEARVLWLPKLKM